jgi:hypothetical protein
LRPNNFIQHHKRKIEMALSGVFIAWGLAVPPALIPYRTSASEGIASAGTSTTSASTADGVKILSINAAAPIFYAVGPTPNASSGTKRYMDPANGREDIIVDAGDKFAWVAA